MNFIMDSEFEIVDQPGLQTKLPENWCYCTKMRALKKKVSPKGFLSSEWKCSKNKGSKEDIKR